jgi:hypothetical protein
MGEIGFFRDLRLENSRKSPPLKGKKTEIVGRFGVIEVPCFSQTHLKYCNITVFLELIPISIGKHAI